MVASTKTIAGQLGAEQGAHLLTKGTLAEALKVAEASQAEALVWKGKAKGESCSPCFICFPCVRPLTPDVVQSWRRRLPGWPMPLGSRSSAGKRKPRVSPIGLRPCLAYFLLRLTPSYLFWRRVGEGGLPGS